MCIRDSNNTKVRAGQAVTDPKGHANGYITHVENHFQKEIEKLRRLRRFPELSKGKKGTRRDEKKGNITGGGKKDRIEEKVHGENDRQPKETDEQEYGNNQ